MLSIFHHPYAEALPEIKVKPTQDMRTQSLLWNSPKPNRKSNKKGTTTQKKHEGKNRTELVLPITKVSKKEFSSFQFWWTLFTNDVRIKPRTPIENILPLQCFFGTTIIQSADKHMRIHEYCRKKRKTKIRRKFLNSL